MNRFIILFICSISFFKGLSQETIVHAVDFYPENIGGKEGLKNFIENHLIYPEVALKNKTEGKVVVHFLCTKNGEVKDAKVVNHLSPETDKEAMRLFSLLKFTPAILNKHAIDFEHSVEIPFKISKYKKAIKFRGFEHSLFTDLLLDTSKIVYEKVDKAARYFYGNDSLAKYIYTSIEYPTNANKLGIEGTVTLSFIVETNGKLSNIYPIQTLGGGCVEEAIRVINATYWKPAVNNGMYVRYQTSYPITFKLSNSYRDNSMGTQNLGGQ